MIKSNNNKKSTISSVPLSNMEDLSIDDILNDIGEVDSKEEPKNNKKKKNKKSGGKGKKK